MAFRQRHPLPLELIMFAIPIIVTALTVTLKAEITGCRHTRPGSQLIGEAYAHT
jgi:hypothetical protein